MAMNTLMSHFLILTADAMHVIDNLVRFTLCVGRMEATGEDGRFFLMCIRNVDKRLC